MKPAVVEAIAALDPVGRCVIALGGGADSAVLAAGALEAFGDTVVIGVFVNHGLEGSSVLKVKAEELCAHLGIPLHIEKAKVSDGPDLESRARDARYAAISSMLGGDDMCCTGHTRDDQAETTLMRLMRGSGPTGLSGIPKSRGRFRRPLLGFARADLRAIAMTDGLPFTDDPANSDPRFLRSRIRTDLIPHLERDYSEAIRDNLVRSADLVRIDRELIDEIAADIPIRVSRGEVGMPIAVLVTAASAVSARVIRRALRYNHDPYGGSHSDVEAVMATAQDGTTRMLTGDIKCVRDDAEVVLVSKRVVAVPSGQTISIGGTFSWDSGLYSVQVTDRPTLKVTSPRRTAISVVDGGTIAVRGAVDGDRIEIDGGTTPVAEVLRAAGVPARKRAHSMLITVDEQIAAVHGARVAPWARPDSGQSAVVVEWEGHT